MYIDFKNIEKSFDNEEILNINSLEIERGEIVSIIGKNGSGKSTLIKILCGLLYQDTGQCIIDGISNKDKKVRNLTKLVLESGGGYYDYLTAIENIKYFLSLNKVAYDETKVNQLIEVLDLVEHKDKKVSVLSQGSRQKLSLIITLLTNPDIICLDEPTNGLDISSMNVLLNFLHKLAKEYNKTIIFTSHDLAFMKNINSRLILMDKGKIVLDKKSNDLFESKEIEKTIIEIPIDDRDILNLLSKTKYVFTDDTIKLYIYEDEEKQIILESSKILNMSSEPLTAEDIYFRVISNV